MRGREHKLMFVGMAVLLTDRPANTLGQPRHGLYYP